MRYQHPNAVAETYLRRVRHALILQDGERLGLGHEDYVGALSDLLSEIECMREAAQDEADEAAEAARET